MGTNNVEPSQNSVAAAVSELFPDLSDAYSAERVRGCDTGCDAGSALGQTPVRSTAHSCRTNIWETGGKRMKANGALLRSAWALLGWQCCLELLSGATLHAAPCTLLVRHQCSRRLILAALTFGKRVGKKWGQTEHYCDRRGRLTYCQYILKGANLVIILINAFPTTTTYTHVTADDVVAAFQGAA
jgi:hypothetical protein